MKRRPGTRITNEQVRQMIEMFQQLTGTQRKRCRHIARYIRCCPTTVQKHISRWLKSNEVV